MTLKYIITIRALLILIVITATASCHSPQLVSVWKSEAPALGDYKSILVVGILSKPETIARENLENKIVKELTSLGYVASSAYDRFGQTGLAQPAQEATYAKLCESGIDAVLTVALVPRADLPVKAYREPNAYYYQKIWNYRNRLDSLDYSGSQYQWEMVLFDLRTLQAICVIESKPFAGQHWEQLLPGLPRDLVGKMLDEKVIRKHQARVLRGF